MIEVRHLSVRYANQQNNDAEALADISLTVPTGAVCAVIGPSGCGKSTLLKVIAGLIRDYEGEALIDGRKVDTKAVTIGFMPQNYGLLPWRTAEENIRLGCRIKGKQHPCDEQRLRELVSILGLEGLLGRYPHELSGGQQQRVSLARVFLLRPDILLMDEPFSALDAITREEMQDVFRTMHEREQLTTILVTHYVEEALYLGQQIVLMCSAPGHVAEIIENSWDAGTIQRDHLEFFRRGQQLRQKIKALGGRNHV